MSATLPGAFVTAVPSITGSSETCYGVGSISIGARRPNGHQMDLCSINYASPTPSAYEDAQTSPRWSDGEKAFGDINRRLSKKQAMWIAVHLERRLAELMKDGIPADDEIENYWV